MRSDGAAQRPFERGEFLAACHQVLKFLGLDLAALGGPKGLAAVEHGEPVPHGQRMAHIMADEDHADALLAKPRRMKRNASVTMKLGSPVRTQIYPFSAPIAMQIAKVKRMATHMGQPNVTPKMAIIIPAKPIMEPTDRSNSPAIINRQAPTAMIMNCAETTDQFSTPWLENIPLSAANNRKKANTAIVPMMPPSSGRIKALRKDDICLMRSSAACGVGVDMALSPSVLSG